MSDMYGKLGEYLNNVLETGEVPQEEILKDQDPCIDENSRENPGPFDFNDHYKTQNSNNFTSFEGSIDVAFRLSFSKYSGNVTNEIIHLPLGKTITLFFKSSTVIFFL